MKYLDGINLDKTDIFSQPIDEIIPYNVEVRIIELFEDSLPLKELGFMEHTAVEDGRPMYHLGDLLNLYIYRYLNLISTSRLRTL